MFAYRLRELLVPKSWSPDEIMAHAASTFGPRDVTRVAAGVSRQRLPNRREHELIEFEHRGIRYTAGVSRPCPMSRYIREQ
jgi:hypothetical protein